MPISQMRPSKAPSLLAWQRFWAPYYQNIRTCGVTGVWALGRQGPQEVHNDGIWGEAGRGWEPVAELLEGFLSLDLGTGFLILNFIPLELWIVGQFEKNKACDTKNDRAREGSQGQASLFGGWVPASWNSPGAGEGMLEEGSGWLPGGRECHPWAGEGGEGHGIGVPDTLDPLTFQPPWFPLISPPQGGTGLSSVLT